MASFSKGPQKGRKTRKAQRKKQYPTESPSPELRFEPGPKVLELIIDGFLHGNSLESMLHDAQVRLQDRRTSLQKVIKGKMPNFLIAHFRDSVNQSEKTIDELKRVRVQLRTPDDRRSFLVKMLPRLIAQERANSKRLEQTQAAPWTDVRFQVGSLLAEEGGLQRPATEWMSIAQRAREKAVLLHAYLKIAQSNNIQLPQKDAAFLEQRIRTEQQLAKMYAAVPSLGIERKKELIAYAEKKNKK